MASVTAGVLLPPPIGLRRVETSDSSRLVGALIDITVSLTVAVLTVLTLVVGRDQLGRVLSVREAVAILIVGWAVDVLLYAVPLARVGGSIGNLLTGRRVVDAFTGKRLPLRRAIRRYFARRNVLCWHADIGRRTAASRATTASHADRVVRSVVVRVS